MELVKAAGKGDIERLSKILRRKKTVEQYGVKALISAAQNDHIECLNKLMKANIDVNGRDIDGQTALIAACYNGKIECVQLLIKAGADVNLLRIETFSRYPYKGTALIAATEKGHVECLDLLINAGADVNVCRPYEINALFVAASKGQAECIRHLLRVPGINCGFKDLEGNSVLLKAARHREPDCMKALLEAAESKGMDINESNNSGQTVLMEAAVWGHDECVKLILDFPNIDVNATDKLGRTALACAVVGRSIKCVELFLKVKSIDINKEFRYGFPIAKEYSILSLACDLWELDIVLALLEAGVKTGYTKTSVRNPLMCMAAMGNIQYVKSLIQSSFSVTKCDSYYKSPLYYAAESGHHECLKILTEAISKSDRLLNGIDIGMIRIFASSAKKLKIFQSLPSLLDAKVFSWSWYPRYHKPAYRSLAKMLVTHGHSPEEFDYNGIVSTPLQHAFMIGDVGLIRYYMASLYLTSRDVIHFQRDSFLHRHVLDNANEKVRILHHNLYSKPWRLETLSFLKVSTILKKDKRRQEIISNSELQVLIPEKIQNRLAFQSQYQSLNVKEWDDIPVDNLDVVGSSWPQDNSEGNVVELEYVNRYHDNFDYDEYPDTDSDDDLAGYEFDFTDYYDGLSIDICSSSSGEDFYSESDFIDDLDSDAQS